MPKSKTETFAAQPDSGNKLKVRRIDGLNSKDKSLQPTDINSVKGAKSAFRGRRGAILVDQCVSTGTATCAEPAQKAGMDRPTENKHVPVVSTTETCRRNPLLQVPLPEKYKSLLTMYGALQTCQELLRSRGQRCTLLNLQAAFESSNKKRLTATSLAQLKFLCPQLIEVEYVRLPIKPESTRQEWQLSVTVPTSTNSPSSPRVKLSKQDFFRQTRSQLHVALAEQVIKAHQAKLAEASPESVASSLIDQTCQPLEEYPDLEEAVFAKPACADSPATPYTCDSKSAIRRLSSTGKPPLQNSAFSRRLSFSALRNSPAPNVSSITDAEVLESLPAELRRRSLDGTLPISMSALKTMKSLEADYQLNHSPAAVATRNENHNKAMLPKVFDTTRTLFGSSGPCAKPMSEVVAAVMHRTGASQLEATQQVEALAKAVPEFMSIQSQGAQSENSGAVVRIKRNCNATQLRARLTDVAAKRRLSLGTAGSAVLPQVAE